jgi:hypothetical protein
MHPSLTYRREIDGLRAIAVLPVIFFHAGFELFKGGFVGVDVFFVISGYLITSTILADKEAGTFTLTSFYERRARRILPALFFVMLVCLPFAWRWMLPDYFENFGQSVVATVSSATMYCWLRPLAISTWKVSLNPCFTPGAWGLKNNTTLYFHCSFSPFADWVGAG